jgi:hypothetical protein
MRRRKSSKPKPSPREQQHRAEQARQNLAATESAPLLHTRAQTTRLLGCSTSSLIRLERMGRLRPIKLNPGSATAQTYYSHDNLLELVADAQGGDHA